ncbi:MAG: TIGR04076 family protein [Candidatus Heimdallarchaeaceae archaeon]|jgi:uncharacterized repeat protein (TIGR04076 family)
MTHEIILKVISQEGHCVAGHKIGDEIIFNFDTNEIKGNVCLHALYSVFPKIFAMAYGAEFPWLEDKDKATHACPDAFNPVVYQVIRKR